MLLLLLTLHDLIRERANAPRQRRGGAMSRMVGNGTTVVTKKKLICRKLPDTSAARGCWVRAGLEHLPVAFIKDAQIDDCVQGYTV